jgi:hypothetical protein
MLSLSRQSGAALARSLCFKREEPSLVIEQKLPMVLDLAFYVRKALAHKRDSGEPVEHLLQGCH